MTRLQKILLTSDALFFISGALLGPIYALFVKEIGGDLFDASGTFALFMITAGVVEILLARWEDKSKHLRTFIILGYGLGVVGYLGYLLVNSVLSLFLVQIILGLASALKDPAYDALFSLAGKRHLAFAWGEWEAMDYLTWGVGALLGGLIAQNFGFKVVLLFMFAFSISSFIISLMLLRRKEKKDEKI